MQYNIFGTSDEWNEQTLGYLRTIEVDPAKLGEALRLIAEEDVLDSEDNDDRDRIRVVVGKGGLDDMFEENEVSWPFAGSLDDVAAYAELNRDPVYSLMWVAMPCQVTAMVIGEG